MPVTTSVTPPVNMFEEAIRQQVKKQIDEAAMNEFEYAMDALRRKIQQIVAGVSIAMMKFVEMETRGDRLIITVRIPEPEAR